MRGFLLTIGCFSFLVTQAQTVAIKNVELAGEKIIVHYDLEDGNPNNEYKLDLYASNDNYATPLTKVKGDVGLEVKPGADRKIEWSIKEELGGYKGKIALEVRGKVYIPFVKIQNFDADKSYKRGNSYNIAWKPGSNNAINIDLYKGGQRVSGESNLQNNGSHTFYIPTHAKKGSDYRLKITDTKNSEDVLYTSEFMVKPKIPLLLKLLPVLAVGGAVAVLVGNGGGPESGGTTADSVIPGVPALPTGN
jgi:hypothetical protein